MEQKKKVAKEITDRLRTASEDSHFAFALARREWEAQFDGSFDVFVAELIFKDDAWLKSSYRGQLRHGKGYRGDINKQLVQLYIF